MKMNRTFDRKLEDTESAEFTELATTIEDSCVKFVANGECQVVKFTEGSVVAEIDIVTDEEGEETPQTMDQILSNVTAQFTKKFNASDIELNEINDVCAVDSTNECSDDATCMSSDTSAYDCKCNKGFTGDGFECTEIDDPCLHESRNNCSDHAHCYSSDSNSYNCSCKAGFNGDGYNCTGFVVEGLPEQVSVEEGDEVELHLVLSEEKDLYTCCDGNDLCTKHTSEKGNHHQNQHVYNVTLKPRRNFCGKHFAYKMEEQARNNQEKQLVNVYETKFVVKFRPQPPHIKDATYDNRTSCLIVEMHPEDTGDCPLRYTFRYKTSENQFYDGEIKGTKTELEGLRIKSCFDHKKALYDNDQFFDVQNIRVLAHNAEEHGGEQSSEETDHKVNVIHSQEPPADCPPQYQTVQ